MEISITFDDVKLRKKIGEMETGLKSYQKPFTDIGEALVDHYGQKVFQTQGRANGAAWRPLSASTLIARNARRGYYAQPPVALGKILIWTGRLQRGFRKKAERFKLTIDNPVDYFKHHQLGGGPPKRPMLAITKDVITEVVEGINQYIRKLINK